MWTYHDDTQPQDHSLGTITILDQNKKIMAYVPPYGGEFWCTYEEAQKIGLLIAAAPELLAACKAAELAFQSCKQLTDAIAKAEGK